MAGGAGQSSKASKSSRRSNRVRCTNPVLIVVLPCLYFGLVVWLQPADRLGIPVRAPGLGRLLYDDWDWTAVLTRVLNAERGRRPGLMNDPCTPSQPLKNAVSSAGRDGIESHYFLEYPAPVVWMFRGILRIVPNTPFDTVPTPFLDACQSAILDHVPSGPDEVMLWRGFRRVIRIWEAVMMFCFAGLGVVLMRGYERKEAMAAPAILLASPALLYFSLNRFDVVPALLTALSLWCLARGKNGASALLLGAGTMVKVYPALLAPLFVRYLMRDRRKAVTWTIIFGASILATLGVTALTVGWRGAIAPFQYQSLRSWEPWSFYGPILPHLLGTSAWSGFRMAAVLVTIARLVRAPITSLASLLSRAVVILMVFISLQPFFSPQWIVWLIPLTAPLAGLRRSLVPWLVAFDAVIYLSFPVVWDHPYLHGMGRAAYHVLIWLRLAIPIVIAFLLMRWDRTDRQPRTEMES